ncbi:MAG: hypothetical protein J5608_00950 [Alphaproteobacteria bacterium]|nr:hypothetical protein [Alphaproteobacteria bacterium]
MIPSGEWDYDPETTPRGDWKSLCICLGVWLGSFFVVGLIANCVGFIKSQIEKDKQEKFIKQAEQEKNAETAYVLGAKPEKVVGCLTSARSR